MLFLCHFQILVAISEIQLTLHKVHTVHMVILPFQQLYENSYSLHLINGMASTGNGRAPVRSMPEDQPTIVRFDEFLCGKTIRLIVNDNIKFLIINL